MIKVANGIFVKESGILDVLHSKIQSVRKGVTGAIGGIHKAVTNPENLQALGGAYPQGMVHAHAPEIRDAIVRPAQAGLRLVRDWAPPAMAKSIERPGSPLNKIKQTGQTIVDRFKKPYQQGLRDDAAATKKPAAKPEAKKPEAKPKTKTTPKE